MMSHVTLSQEEAVRDAYLLEIPYCIGIISGIKIDLHNQDNLPAVRDVGDAASLSTHTLFGISYMESMSLSEPYGDCIHEHESAHALKLFPDNTTYSKSRCDQECETNHVVESCDCKLFYMPGKWQQQTDQNQH